MSLYAKEKDPQLLVLAEPDTLTRTVGDVRRRVQRFCSTAKQHSMSVVDSGIDRERELIASMRNVVVTEEATLPSLAYTGIAALAGSILTARRSLPLRFVTPPLLFAAAASYFLPQSFANIRSHTWAYEQKHLPSLAATHAQLYDQTSSFAQSVRARLPKPSA